MTTLTFPEIERLLNWAKANSATEIALPGGICVKFSAHAPEGPKESPLEELKRRMDSPKSIQSRIDQVLFGTSLDDLAKASHPDVSDRTIL